MTGVCGQGAPAVSMVALAPGPGQPLFREAAGRGSCEWVPMAGQSRRRMLRSLRRPQQRAVRQVSEKPTLPRHKCTNSVLKFEKRKSPVYSVSSWRPAGDADGERGLLSQNHAQVQPTIHSTACGDMPIHPGSAACSRRNFGSTTRLALALAIARRTGPPALQKAKRTTCSQNPGTVLAATCSNSCALPYRLEGKRCASAVAV